MSKFFDSTEPEFTVSMRGYDRHQVDDYAQRLYHQILASEKRQKEAERHLDSTQTQLRRAEDRIGTLERRLNDNAIQLAEQEQPTLAGLGSRVEKILRAAEYDAGVTREETKRASAKLIADARNEADIMMRKAQGEASEITTSCQQDVAEMRQRAQTETTELCDNARRNHDMAIADAQRESEAQRSHIKSETTELRQRTEREIAVLRATAEREVTEVKAQATREADEQRSAAQRLLAEAVEVRKQKIQELTLAEADRRERAEQDEAKRHQQAITTAQRIVEEAEERVSEADRRLRQTETWAAERCEQTDQQVKEIRKKALDSAEQLRLEAEKEADRLRRVAQDQADEDVLPLKEEVETMERQQVSAKSNLVDLQRQLGLISMEAEAPVSSPRAATTEKLRSESPELESLAAQTYGSESFSSAMFEDLASSSGSPIPINEQRKGSDIDETQQLPVVT
ncbi:hypothetical protein [Natronoglycomyces albus]|uniref:Cell division protein DivIVA n=1 Tax=Natronoglycomyces albus TaxID=2811108 RepID=A0A895XQA0_9ACTN|nr:hypothetical protein [Natronoglycomyces albus]QSB05549.1 hypothetical protein JQS30_00995 [Natronoglycomyces albus]